MTKNYKILAKYIRDMSSETPDAETYMYVKDNISRYQLGIDINSKAIKSRLIEVDTSIKFHDKKENVKKSIFDSKSDFFAKKRRPSSFFAWRGSS